MKLDFETFKGVWPVLAFLLLAMWGILKFAFGLDKGQALQDERLKEVDDTLTSHDSRITTLEREHVRKH